MSLNPFKFRAIHRWLPSYVRSAGSRRDARPGEAVHVLLCIADHYEPSHGGVSRAVAQHRVQQWIDRYPQRFGRFHDSDGRPPRHTFFYPLEEYDAGEVDALAGLCRRGFGEVEIHLHHDNDTAEVLRERLLDYINLLHSRHQLLPLNRETRQVRYGFIHGDWALDNSSPDGHHCGVNNELDVLRETGCYADFTMPSAPDVTQTRQINSIYYAVDDPHRPCSHDRGVPVGSMARPKRSLMLIQGPLVLDWRRRKLGCLPRIENGCLQGNQPATAARIPLWLRARIQVPSRPDWFFVKLHTHGGPEANHDVLLGEPMVAFHEHLSRRAAEDANFQFHYVTAREMYNLARAAEDGWGGSVNDARDYELVWPGVSGETPRPVSSAVMSSAQA